MPKTLFYSLLCFFLAFSLQTIQAQDTIYTNSVNNMFNNEKNLSIRGYAQIDFNQPIEKEIRRNGKLEVHRLVLFAGYRFNSKLQFISEIEVEHGDQIFIEQAFAQYKLRRGMNLRAGMIVIPMGIINEYHEPTTYHGVERPNVDNVIIPTTWRELALGINGVISQANLRYQLYITNGFLSHDGTSGIIRGVDGLRKGRQKGLRSTLSSPNVSAKFDYFGMRNLKLGLSVYGGKTQSRLYDGLDKNAELLTSQADSSVIGLFMVSADARYTKNGFEGRAVYVFSNHSDASAYNAFTGQDLGSQMTGYYIEAAYDVLTLADKTYKTSVLPFIRYEKFDTHARVDQIEKNEAFNRQEITAGISWRHQQSVSFKADYQWIKNGLNEKMQQLNLGVGVWF